MKACLITNDLFDVASRLKEIDVGYQIYYNKQLGRFEVHNRFQHGNTLSVVVPFDRLDARTVELVQKTRVENIKTLLAEMEKANEQAEKDATKKAFDRYAKEMKL